MQLGIKAEGWNVEGKTHDFFTNRRKIIDDQKWYCKREEMLIAINWGMFYVLKSHFKVWDISEQRLLQTTHSLQKFQWTLETKLWFFSNKSMKDKSDEIIMHLNENLMDYKPWVSSLLMRPVKPDRSS